MTSSVHGVTRIYLVRVCSGNPSSRCVSSISLSSGVPFVVTVDSGSRSFSVFPAFVWISGLICSGNGGARSPREVSMGQRGRGGVPAVSPILSHRRGGKITSMDGSARYGLRLSSLRFRSDHGIVSESFGRTTNHRSYL